MLRRLLGPLWALALAFAFSTLIAMAAAAAGDDNPALLNVQPEVCVAPADQGQMLDAEKAAWNACEKWVWSCLRQGLEANLFLKQKCVVPRPPPLADPRKQLRHLQFVDPGRFRDSNGITDKFLVTILTNPDYVKQLPPVGVRIYGAYFADPVNLENVTTPLNVVLDGSMARAGLRLTNFETKKNLSLDGSNIHGPLRLMRAHIDGSIFMERSVVDMVDLSDARVGASFEALGALSNEDLRLDRASIAGKVVLSKARLTRFSAWNAFIGGSVLLRLATCGSAWISPAPASKAIC